MAYRVPLKRSKKRENQVEERVAVRERELIRIGLELRASATSATISDCCLVNCVTMTRKLACAGFRAYPALPFGAALLLLVAQGRVIPGPAVT